MTHKTNRQMTETSRKHEDISRHILNTIEHRETHRDHQEKIYYDNQETQRKTKQPKTNKE